MFQIFIESEFRILRGAIVCKREFDSFAVLVSSLLNDCLSVICRAYQIITLAFRLFSFVRCFGSQGTRAYDGLMLRSFIQSDFRILREAIVRQREFHSFAALFSSLFNDCLSECHLPSMSNYHTRFPIAFVF